MNDGELIAAYNRGWQAVHSDWAKTDDLTTENRLHRAGLAEVARQQAERILTSLDRLYFNGGYRTVNRGMVERAIREATHA